MIEQITLKNFQAHAHTEIDFHPGINVIVGTSDSGKTSILRALRWAHSNRPTGNGIVNNGIRKKNGDPSKDVITSIKFSNGVLTRVKGPDRNGYDVGGEELGAIGTDVPTQATELFNATDLNFSNQHDKPFLIGETPGEVGRFLNKLIKIDRIDAVLSKAEKKKRATRALVDEKKLEAENLVKKLELYRGVDKAKKLYDELLVAEKGKELLGAQASDLRQIIATDKTHKDRAEWIKRTVGEAHIILANLDSLVAEKTRLEDKHEAVSILVDGIKKYDAVEAKRNDYIVAKNLLAGFDALTRERSEAEGRRVMLTAAIKALSVVPKFSVETLQKCSDLLFTYDSQVAIRKALIQKIRTLDDILNADDEYDRTIRKLRTEIKVLRDSLPDVCEVCGSSVGGHSHG